MRLLKRIAKALLWNRKDDLQGCIRACKGIRQNKRVLVTSGIFSFMVYRDGSLAMIVGKDYAKSLDSLTYKWKKVIRDDESVVKTGEPLGGQFATYPHTFKRRCEDMVMSLSEENGAEMGSHTLQKVAMALVVRGVVRFERISSLSDD